MVSDCSEITVVVGHRDGVGEEMIAWQCRCLTMEIRAIVFFSLQEPQSAAIDSGKKSGWLARHFECDVPKMARLPRKAASKCATNSDCWTAVFANHVFAVIRFVKQYQGRGAEKKRKRKESLSLMV